MSAAHTPGPWHVATYGCSPDYFAIKQGPCTLATKITTEQDARLIAAAPDLLAVLERLSLCVAGMDQFSLDEDFEAARDQARNVSAKAKGTV